jgi:hypothetical protein
VCSDSLEETVEVIISGIVQLLKCIKSFGEVSPKLWCVIVLER